MPMPMMGHGPWAMGLSGFVRWLLEALGSLERLRAHGTGHQLEFLRGYGQSCKGRLEARRGVIY